MNGGVLTALIFLPLIGALFILMQSEERAIWNSAFIFSLLPLALSFYVLFEFNPQSADYQFVEQYDWIPAFGITYHLGIDGISLFLVLLTTILITLSMLYSGGGDIEERPREFCFFMLVLETGLLGALLAVDLFLFYVFWEVMLIPMYFLIGIWGHGRKIYAAIKFVLFTMVGSLLMLVAILYLVYQAHVHFNRISFDLPLLYQVPLSVDAGPLAVRGVRARVRDQSADVAGAYLAARRAHQRAHGGFRHPGRRDAQDGHLRLPALRDSAVPGGRGRGDSAVHGAGGDRDHLRRAGRDDAAGPQAPDRLFVG